MMKTLHSLDLQLTVGELRRWRSAGAVELQVLAGRVWVTQSNDEDDHFLAAGDTLALRRGALALIEAEADASLRLFVPAAAALPTTAWWHRIAGRRRPPATVAG
jgi:quercetin dioxygenase-like cupin family protein